MTRALLTLSLLGLTVAFALAGTARAQDSQPVVTRISAMPLGDGRIEFALQLREERCADDDDGADLMQVEVRCRQITEVWGERVLPRVRKFPSEPTVDRWYSSSPPVMIGEVETRIRVRRLEDGRTEFALQQKSDGESWGDHILPSSRLISEAHRTSHLGRWLNSSPILAASVIVVPEVVVPAGVPIVAEAVLEYADLDGWTFNGNEPSFFYVVRQDPIDDTYYTGVIKVAKTDDDLYDTIRLQVSCYAGQFQVFLWEDSLPYQRRGSSVRVSYRFDSGEVSTERWSHYSAGDDGILTNDDEAFAEQMRSADTLVIRATFLDRTLTATFNGVSRMFQTRVQPNIEYCGHY